MFEILNLLFMTVPLFLSPLWALDDVQLPPFGGGVAQVRFSTAAPVLIRVRPRTEEEKCIYSGVMVPFDRTWEEVTRVNDMDLVSPPEPGKIAGYGVLVNRKECEGKAPEAIFRIGSPNNGMVMARQGRMMEGAVVYTSLLSELSTDQRPKWLDQVLDTVTKVAESDPAVKSFVEFSMPAATKNSEQAGDVQPPPAQAESDKKEL